MEAGPGDRLGHAGEMGERLPRGVSDRLKDPAGSFRTVPTEPSEQLLSAVTDEQTADDHAQDEKTDGHGDHPSFSWLPRMAGGETRLETPPNPCPMTAPM